MVIKKHKKSSIVFNINCVGNGSCFNYEGNHNLLSSNMYSKENPDGIKMDYDIIRNGKDSITFAKIYVYNDNKFCYKVTGDCFKKQLYSNTMIGRTPSNCIAGLPFRTNISAMIDFFSNPYTQMHGYLSAVSNKGENATVKKDAALKMSDFRECEADFKTPVKRDKLDIEQYFTTASYKGSSTPHSRTGTSCSEYFVSTNCVLSAEDLEFISNDDLHGRNALRISDEHCSNFIEGLKINFNSDDIKYGFFKKVNELDYIAEKGFKLGPTAINNAFKMMFKKILNTKIYKTKGSLEVVSITLNSVYGVETITLDNVDDLEFDIEETYVEVKDLTKIEEREKAFESVTKKADKKNEK